MDYIAILRQSPVAALIFLVTIVTSLFAFSDKSQEAKFIFNPWTVVREKQYYRIFTSALIHGGWMHLGFNMLAYYYFAFTLEHIMIYDQSVLMADKGYPEWLPSALGHFKFLVLYVAATIISHLPTLIKEKDNPAYNSLGASGAISGVVLSVILFRPTSFEIWGMPSWVFGLVYIGGSFLLSRIKLSAEQMITNPMARVNHEAHLWGGLAGVVFTLMLFPSQAVYLWELIKYYVS